MKRLLLWIAGGAAALALLFFGASAIAFWLVDVDAIVREQIARQKPEIERQLGRRIAIGEVSTRFFPTLGANVSDVRIEAAEGASDTESLLRIEDAGFDLDLWGALLSGGREVSLRAIYLDGVRLHLVRQADGTLSIDDLLEKAEAEDAPAEEQGGLDAQTLELLQRIAIDEIRLSDARIELVDHAASGGSATHVVDRIDLRLRDVALGSAVRIELRAAAFADADNVDFAATVGPIPADLQLDGLLPLADVRLRIDGVDLSRARTWLPAGLRAGVIASDLRLPRLVPGAKAELEGHLAVRGLQFEGGEPVDVRLDADVVADLQKLGAAIDELRLRIGAMEIAASGAVHDLAEAPRFENLVVRTANLGPEALFRAFPQARAALPAGSRMAGIATLELRASGDAKVQSVNLRVDLGGVDVHLPGMLAKPAGTPFALRVEGDFGPSSVRLHKANLRLDELDLDLHGEVRDFAAPVYDFVLAAKPFSMDRLVRLIPEANARMQAANVRAEGRGSLSGHLKGEPGKLSANLALALQDVDLELPDTTLRGGLELRAFASGDPAGRLQAGLRLDAGDSVIRIPGLLQKEATTPLLVDLTADTRGDRIEIRKFDVRLAELALRARGALGSGDAAVDVELPAVDLEKLARTIPAIPVDRVRGGRVEAALRLRGDPAAPASMRAELQRLDLRLGASDLQITGVAENLDAPRIEAALTSRLLDLDALLPADEGKAGKAAEETEREDDPSLRALHAMARFDLARVRLKGRLLENVRGRLVLEDGVLRIEEGRFDLYGGEVRAAGTEAAIWRGAMPFRARLVAQNVDVGRLLAGESDRRPLLGGRGNLDVDLAGEGFSPEAIEQHLSGAWKLTLKDGTISSAPITSSIVGGLAEVPGLSPERLASEGELRDLLASFTVEKGRMNLAQPLRLQLDGNRVELGGAVGVLGDLFLQGTYYVSPQLVQRISGGRCSLSEEAAVPLRIGGSVSEPAVQPDAASFLGLVAKGCLAARAQDAVDRLTGGAAKEAVGTAEAKAREAAARASEEVDAARRAAERKAAEMKAEAERKKREAEEKARKAAEEKARKLKNRLGF